MQDNGGTANGGVDLDASPNTITINITAVNDAPTISGQMPVSTAFNTARTIMFSDLQVTDIDDSYPADFTLSAMDGVNYTRSGHTITPALNFFGTLAVPVKVNDGGLDSNTFQLAMTVNPDPEAVQRLKANRVAATTSASSAIPASNTPCNIQTCCRRAGNSSVCARPMQAAPSSSSTFRLAERRIASTARSFRSGARRSVVARFPA